MSGLTPKRSTAPPAAIVSPVFTSSKISTAPCRAVGSRDRLEVAGLGQHQPAFVMTASITTHAGFASPIGRPSHPGR